MEKKCTKCKRRIPVGKFGSNKSMPDGKQVWCRECINKNNRMWKKTPRGRYLQRQAADRWKDDNKDQVSEYNKNYYMKYKERIISRRNTESIIIVGNVLDKNINKRRKKYKKIDYDIVIEPKEKNG